MKQDVVDRPAGSVSNEELADFYAKMGLTRKCHYLITNFLEDAEAARKMASEGASWDDVAARYHDGDIPPSGKLLIDVPFGTYGPDFETPIFDTEVGEVTPPIQTVYGFWVLRVDNEIQAKPGKKPTLDSVKAKILDTIYNRKTAKIRDDFRKSVREKYKLTIHDDALWKCYQGLPADEVLLDPKTQEPTPKKDLKPLNIKPSDMDMPFYSYQVGDEVKAYTLGDYKAIFDRMSVFQRPKRSEMLGSLRNKIQQELEKALLNLETKDRGYDKDPRVLAATDEKMEELLVTKLYKDLVQVDQKVSPEQVKAFWADHQQEYAVPETRSGHMVICLNKDDADKARAAIAADTPWKDILLKYGSDRDNKSKGGRLEDVYATSTGPARDALFALAEGSLSDPFPLDNGRFGVVKCESITAPHPGDRVALTQDIGSRIKKIREEDLFQKLLAQWTEEFGVTVHEENLAGLPSWDELKNPPLPDNIVPRS